MKSQKKSTLEECREKLTVKRQRFCEEYAAGNTGKASALAAGFSERTAVEQAGNLLKMQPVQDYLEQLRLKQQHRTDSDADKVVEEFSKIAFANIKNYYDSFGKLKDVKDLPDDVAAAIHSVKETEYKGKDDSVKVIREFKLHDKISSLRELGLHYDIYDKEKSKETPKVQVDVHINRHKNSGSKEA